MLPRSTRTPAPPGSSQPSSTPGTPASQRIRQRRENLSHSQYAPVAVKAFIDLLPKAASGKAVGPIGKSILDDKDVEPAPTRLPGDYPDLTLRRPSNPFHTRRQVKLYNALQACGRAGVAHVLYEECKKEKADKIHKSATWDTFIEDSTNGNEYVTLLLSMLPKAVIGSLIKGTWNYNIRHDMEVKRYLSFMKPASLPGIYLNTIAHPSMTMPGQATNTEPGLWFSTNQINSLLDKYTAYIDDTDKATNDAIDQMFIGNTDRKWAQNDRQREKGKAWIKEIRRQYCDKIESTEMDEPHFRAPIEIGWSRDVRKRLQQHSENSSTTYIFGFNNAVTRLPRIKGGFGFVGQPITAVLFPVWKKDDDLANIAEILGSLLTGSYWYHGGYNCTFAGTFSINLDEGDPRWDAARKNAQDRLRFCQGPDSLVSEATDLQELLESYRSRDQDREQLDELKESLRRANHDNDKAKDKTRKQGGLLREAYEDLELYKQKYYAVMDSRATTRGEQQIGTFFSSIEKNIESSDRVDEDYERRAELPYARLRPSTYQSGPKVTIQSLSAEEQAQIGNRITKQASQSGEAYANLLARREARKLAKGVSATAAGPSKGSKV
ncbi:MAG: hypothetical protein L6R41_006895 [Letrouitia leprolyta]|nr:MAG: hypothetical protein L6R41_006895 [Letrouitia leprolyta]